MDDKVKHSLKIIKEVLTHHKKVAVACSFGKDSMATLHLIRRIKLDVPVFTIMTPFKPKETFTFMETIKRIWNLKLTVYQSIEKPIECLHRTDPNKCCHIFKVLPTMDAVKDLDAWISGLRKTEGITRSNFQEIEIKGGLVKVNPILQWTEADVWRYIATNYIPFHPWYELGYRSLGCACCSSPNTIEERGGRWKGTVKQSGECGIHTKNLRGN